MTKKDRKPAAPTMDDFWGKFLLGGINQIAGQIERSAMQQKRAEEQEKEETDGNGNPRWFYKLDVEIWRHIIGFLVPPRLKPLSGRTKQEYAYEQLSDHQIQRDDYASLPDISEPGCVSREDMRARDLATLMRTSIAFNQITADHLYRHVRCDSLPLLLYGVDTLTMPTHVMIDNKRKLLERTRSLQLEYLSKRDNRHTSYMTLMRNPLSWGQLGDVRDVVNALHQAAAEALSISDRVEEVLRPVFSTPPGPYFPKLTHLSVGAIFGAHEYIWDGVTHPATRIVFQNPTGRKEDERPPIRKLVENCRVAVMRLFRSSPIVHYCSRSTFGPYALPVGFVWGAPPPSSDIPTPPPTPTFTFHYTTTAEFVRAAIGSPTRWLLENEERHLYTTGSLVRNFMMLLENYHKQVREAGFKHPKFDIEMFISGSRYSPPNKRWVGQEEDDASSVRFASLKEEAGLIRGIWQSNYQQMRGAGMPPLLGVSNWRSSAESGGCEACHWEFEELGQKRAVPAQVGGGGQDTEARVKQIEELNSVLGSGGKKIPGKGKGRKGK